jgi:ankyrin repeat protein
MEEELDRAGRSALHYAALDGDVDRVIELIAQGADVNAVDQAGGHTALHFAAQGQHTETARALLSAGAEVDARDRFGKTPLSMALFNVRDRDGEVIRVLLASGADPNLKNNNGISPRGLVETVDNYDLKRFLD